MTARSLGKSKRFSRPALRKGVLAAVATAGLLGAMALAPGASQATAKPPVKKPTHVLIVLFDQMRPEYADRFNMTNFKALRAGGTNFRDAQLGYMGSETVISHNAIVSGQLPKHMGWTDEVYRDANNLLGKGANTVHITGDLSMANFNTLIADKGYPKLANYLHTKTPGSKFIAVGEKSYAVESAAAGTDNATDIAVRLGSRKAAFNPPTVPTGCSNLNGSWRGPAGFNVPSYLTTVDPVDATKCGRYYINSDKGNDYGTLDAFPSWIYAEEGNRFFKGSDASAAAGHLGGDVWAADAAMEMMEKENWSGMFVTLGGIDKAGHMWGADQDTDGHDCSVGTGQVHVDCAAKIADEQLGRMVEKLKTLGLLDDTLIVLTADHGATHGGSYYGKQGVGDSDSNWYWAPTPVYDGGAIDTFNTYNRPSPALLPLNATGNLQMSYQSTSIQAWLLSNTLPEMQAVGGGHEDASGGDRELLPSWRPLQAGEHQPDVEGRSKLVEAQCPADHRHDGR